MTRTDGGSVWESNPPARVLARPASFEDWWDHQAPSAPACAAYRWISLRYRMRCGWSASAPSRRRRSVSFAAGQHADFLLLVAALEAEPGAIRARVHGGAAAELDLALPVRDFIPHA